MSQTMSPRVIRGMNRARASGQNIGRLLEALPGMSIEKDGMTTPVRWLLVIERPDGHMQLVETLEDAEPLRLQ